MPHVDVLPHMVQLFAKARAEVAEGGSEKGLDAGQRCIGVVTPGRMLTFVPAPKAGSVAPEHVTQAKSLVPSNQPLNVTVVAFTELEPFMRDKTKCIPFLSRLLALAYIGHNVIVFEGDKSAFESALQNSDMLLIDSGMLPFLQNNWLELAQRAITAKSRILGYERENGRILPIVKSKASPGWRYTEPDGEVSYVNCLLTTLAKRSAIPVQVVAGQPPPDLKKLASDPKEIEWAADLPFQYEALSAEKVMGIIHRLAKWSPVQNQQAAGSLQTKLAAGGGPLRSVTFQLVLVKDDGGKYRLSIEKSTQL